MSLTRADLIKRGVLRMGGHAGTLSFTALVNNRAILAGQLSTSNDDADYVGWKLFMLDATNETDRERTVTFWDASEGIAGWEKIRADTTSTNENYILSPDYSLDEYRQALNKALRTTRRSYRYILPCIPGVTDYSLDRLTWLSGAKDIDSVTVSQSPNWLHNEDFEYWDAGSASAPDGWTLAGAGATVARSATGIRSPYSATVTRASADATLYQSIPAPLVQYLVRSSFAPLPLLSFGAWVTSTTANIARVGLYNGSTTTWTPYYTLTSGVPVFLSSTYQMTATDTAIRLVCSVDTTNGAVSFHAAVLTPYVTVPAQLRDRGSKVYAEYQPYVVKRNTGGWPTLELADEFGYAQLVVTSRRPFPEMTADTDVIEDQYAEALVFGMLRFLTDPMKPNEDRTRPDRIRGEEAAKWANATADFVDKPVQPPPRRVQIGGA